MIKTITYLGINKVTYKFSKWEIQEALTKHFKIESGRKFRVEFEMYDDGDPNNEAYAELIIYYIKEERNESPTQTKNKKRS